MHINSALPSNVDVGATSSSFPCLYVYTSLPYADVGAFVFRPICKVLLADCQFMREARFQILPPTPNYMASFIFSDVVRSCVFIYVYHYSICYDQNYDRKKKIQVQTSTKTMNVSSYQKFRKFLCILFIISLLQILLSKNLASAKQKKSHSSYLVLI